MDGVFQYPATLERIHGFELLEGVKITPKMGLWEENSHKIHPKSASWQRKGLLSDFREIGNFPGRFSSFRSRENANQVLKIGKKGTKPSGKVPLAPQRIHIRLLHGILEAANEISRAGKTSGIWDFFFFWVVFKVPGMKRPRIPDFPRLLLEMKL